MKLRKTILAAAVSVALLVGQAQAGDEKYKQLEDRIQSLEAMLAELKKELDSKDAPAASSQPTAAPKPEGGESHNYKFGGFVKATGSYSRYSDGDLASGSAGRDFYIPGTIPVGGEGEGTDFDFGAKESRINFSSSHDLGDGNKVSTFIEMDFLLGPGGNERVSNSYNPRMRHAFLRYNNWLFGQTWSTFQDVGALPESADFLAASDGIVFERQAMVRYTNGPWQVALENPETTVTPFGGGGRIVSDDNGMPDFVAKYTHKSDWGHVAIAGLMRQLQYDVVGNSESEMGFGLSLTGKVNVGEKDDFKFNIATGSGMGRYVGLNTANGAVIDVDGSLQAIDSTLAAVAYRHFWTDTMRSNFILSAMDVDNDLDLTGLGVTKRVQSAQINLLFSPVKKTTLGIGFLHANRELESGIDGELNRLILSAKYAF